MRIPRRPYGAPQASSWDWAEAFARPGPATLQSFSTGELVVRLSGMVDLAAPEAASLVDATVRVPVYAHLVRHDALGDSVIDPGLDRGYQRHKAGSVRGLARPFLPIPGFQAKGQDLRTRLDELGSSPKRVFYTHLHFDHSAGALDMPPLSTHAAAYPRVRILTGHEL